MLQTDPGVRVVVTPLAVDAIAGVCFDLLQRAEAAVNHALFARARGYDDSAVFWEKVALKEAAERLELKRLLRSVAEADGRPAKPRKARAK